MNKLRGIPLVVAAALLWTTAACSDGGDSSAEEAPAVTGDQAREALVPGATLPAEWDPSGSGRGPGDELLDGTTGEAGCQSFLEDLRSGGLIGAQPGTQAVRHFTDQQTGGELDYQVAAYTKSQVESGIDRLKRVPEDCDRFTTTDGARKSVVQVVDQDVPEEGDESTGLRMTLATRADGADTELTMDIAVVRVGPNALVTTNGSLQGADSTTTGHVVEVGAQRLEDILAGRLPSPPEEFPDQ